jgi:4,5-DOPA dioxygenase extradiol
VDGTAAAPVKAILVISAHWEESTVTVQTGSNPPMYYDYYGFPDEMYKLSFPAPGSPAVASRVKALLEKAGLQVKEDAKRGFDHGVFIPMKLA